ncbi:MAG: phospholipase D-like domain-containing protein [Cyanobacteria bacterium J06649_5]
MFQRFLRRPWRLLFAIALLLTLLSSWRRLTAASPALQPTQASLPQDPWVQVFFNQSEASVYRDPYRHIERHGDDLEQVVITAIDTATTSVDVAVQALNLPRVAQALVRQHQQGVRVRLILENQYANPTSTKAKAEQTADWMAIADVDQNGNLTAVEIEQADALGLLRRASIPRIDDTADGSKGSGLMHHKFVIIDSRWVLTGSANFTLSGIHGDGKTPSSRGNANMLLKIDSPALAKTFTQEFQKMWGDGPAGAADSQFGLKKRAHVAQQVELPTSTITVQFSPHSSKHPWAQSVNGLIRKTLAQSTRSIDMALFVFSEQRLANQLEKQAQAGTLVRALIDPSFAYRSYSEALDMLGVTILNQRCRIEAENRPWDTPIQTVGYPQLPPGDKLHHKFAVVDGVTVIVGSQNWSHAANTNNDETLLVFQNPTVAAHFTREFNRLYHSPKLGNTSSLQRKIQDSQQRCRQVRY